MADSRNIIFMGTPEFAIPSLAALHKAGHDVRLVVTPPDRPRGRGCRVCEPPVKSAALAYQYPVFQPLSLKKKAVIQRLRALSPDLIVTVAFGQILSREILNIPGLGAVNVHASLLPEYRGPAPIHWAIVNGETQTGVTTMMMDTGMDTGDILLQEKTDIGPEETAQTLHDRLSEMGGRALVKTVSALAAGTLKPIAQDEEQATHAPMLCRKSGEIDWGNTAAYIERFIRGMSPWPGAFTFYGKDRIKIHKAAVMDIRHNKPPGTVMDGFSGELRVAAGDGVLSILEIQGASGRGMRIGEYLRGHDIPAGSRLGNPIRNQL